MEDFNPRSRVGNDGSNSFFVVSLRAFQSTFPRGERQYFPLTNIYCYIFQSTFPRGEQQGTVMSLEHRVYFNPRSRVGNDEKRVYGIVKPNIISIHIPAWGTTRKTFWCSTKSYFNPRSRVGNDSLFRTSSASSTYFNPRSRVGNDYDPGNSDSDKENFNPRSRVGND